ncbi:hypothetical protein P167DRAFT_568965 [Morchella conica CCBAS932]|uniref:Uncharacterized protein n=1 Tax=Morchella conica CCBAS932 TaxID=1392247 RepID=A0A3N4KM02_9PEZI|nr:hypothetical protein P167DRAFT_568965 [Morchella conica CCBAS932]
MSTAHIPQTLLHPDTVNLGRLTTNANRAHLHSHGPLPPRPRTPERHTAYHAPLTETRRFTKGSNTSLALHDLLRLAASTDSTTTATLTAPHATTHDLSNSDSWFREACRNPATRLWLQETIDHGRDVYLIVGHRTASHASLTSNGSIKRASKFAGGVLLYRKVKFKWLSCRKVQNMDLEQGNRWKTVWDWRGARKFECDEDDVLEAELTDFSDFEDDGEGAVDDERREGQVKGSTAYVSINTAEEGHSQLDQSSGQTSTWIRWPTATEAVRGIVFTLIYLLARWLVTYYWPFERARTEKSLT